MEKQASYENQQRQHAAAEKSSPLENSTDSKSSLPTLLTPESTPPTSTPSAGNTSVPDVGPSATTPPRTPTGALQPSANQVLKPGLAPVCDTAAKTLAYTTEQTALAAEDTYHTSQMVIALLTGNQNAENSRHLAAVQQIENTYSDNLALADCLD
jgi:hypothetical protein